MWPLRWFRCGEGIDSAEACLLDGPGEAQLMSRDGALAIARGRGLHLIPEWPGHLVTGPAWCRIGKVSLPRRREHVPEPEQAQGPDPLPWFEAPCGRDLPAGSGGTCPGRIAAWCPDRQVSCNTSLAETGQMPQQVRYYVAGFLAGKQPGPPSRQNPGPGIEPGDLTAWKAATSRFRRTGRWPGRWRTCQACGRVLLPGAAAGNCQEHLPDTDIPGQPRPAACGDRRDGQPRSVRAVHVSAAAPVPVRADQVQEP